MARLIRTARAETDLIEIWRFIAKDNTKAADDILDRIDAACARLADYPQMGAARDDLATEFRYFVVGRYLILYRPVANGIEVIRVVHGARYLPDLI